MSNEFRAGLGDPVGKGETELGNEKLLDVWALDITSLLELLDTENLNKIRNALRYCQCKLPTMYMSAHT